MQMEYRGARHQPARHAGPPGLLGRHLPRADRGRRGADGDRRRERRRGADAPPARRSAARATRRSSPSSTSSTARCGSRSSCSTRSSASSACRRAVHLADRHGQALRRRVRHPRDQMRVFAPGEDRARRRRGDARGHRQPGERRALRRRAATHAKDEIELLARRRARVRRERSSPASRRRCSSARRSTTSACRKCSTRWSTSRRRRATRVAVQRAVAPDEAKFTGVVFKIQANMDPAHRDRVAFVRVCSGRFERGMRLKVVRSGKEVRPEHRRHVPVAAARDARRGVSPATSSASRITACCSWATRSPKARRCSSPACRSSRRRSSTPSRSPIRCATSSCAPACSSWARRARSRCSARWRAGAAARRGRPAAVRRGRAPARGRVRRRGAHHAERASSSRAG